MNLQFKFLAVAIVLAIIAMWLEGCTFAVVEDAPVQITWAQAALAEEGDFIGRGSRDAAGETRVKEIQSRLQSLGYLNEVPDGIFGKNTEGALIRFQAENGLAETGVVDYATGYRLVSPMAKAMPEPEPVDLKKGDYGDQVEQLQELLLVYGFTAQAPDRSYGPDTVAAVKRAQDYALYHHRVNYSGEDRAEYGNASAELFVSLRDGVLPVCDKDSVPGHMGATVERIQNRLTVLGYLFGSEPGVYDEFTREAVYWFQAKNNIEKTGIADKYTQKKLFSSDAKSPETVEHPYFMRVCIDEQRVYVYRWVCGGYNQLIKKMICSTGKPGWDTPKGLFHSSGHAGDRWHHFKMNDTYGQYAFNINGNILFHSILYWEADEKTLQVDTLNALGTPASHGCVRLNVDDAYWIYWNNKPGAPIEVY